MVMLESLPRCNHDPNNRLCKHLPTINNVLTVTFLLELLVRISCFPRVKDCLLDGYTWVDVLALLPDCMELVRLTPSYSVFPTRSSTARCISQLHTHPAVGDLAHGVLLTAGYEGEDSRVSDSEGGATCSDGKNFQTLHKLRRPGDDHSVRVYNNHLYHRGHHLYLNTVHGRIHAPSGGCACGSHHQGLFVLLHTSMCVRCSFCSNFNLYAAVYGAHRILV